MELRRWQPSLDFDVVRSEHRELLALTEAGRSRCADGVCAGTQAIFDAGNADHLARAARVKARQT